MRIAALRSGQSNPLRERDGRTLYQDYEECLYICRYYEQDQACAKQHFLWCAKYYVF